MLAVHRTAISHPVQTWIFFCLPPVGLARGSASSDAAAFAALFGDDLPGLAFRPLPVFPLFGDALLSLGPGFSSGVAVPAADAGRLLLCPSGGALLLLAALLLGARGGGIIICFGRRGRRFLIPVRFSLPRSTSIVIAGGVMSCVG